jgi:fructoselysine-6-phosphate deglycase
MLKFDADRYLKVTKGAIGLRNQIETAIDEISQKPFKNILNSLSTIPAYAEIASEFMLQNHKQFGKDSLVILSSLSGKTEETVAAAEYCKSRGAVTIGLVGELNTPLADIVQYPIVNYAENDFAADSINLQMYVVVFRLMHNHGDFPAYDRFITELQSIPQTLIQVKESADKKAQKFVEQYKDETYHMLVGSGTSWGRTYAYAMCVLEEMQWIRTKAIHAAEFFHGTLEIVDEETSMILLKCEDETRPLMDRVERFAEQYTKKLSIYDTKDYALEGISTEFRKYLAPLVLATALQRLSVQLEEKRQHSLDKRRYYRTVTY